MANTNRHAIDFLTP